MNKPQPKSEIVVKGPYNAQTIHITVGSEDARLWLEQEAPKYGVLFPPTATHHYDLMVSDLYDAKEVADYLASFGVA